MEIGRVNNTGSTATEKEMSKTPSEKMQDSERKEDSVEISVEARKRLAALADQGLKEVQHSELTASPKLARIRNRIASGFYDRAEVIDKITEKLADEIRGSDNQQKSISEES